MPCARSGPVTPLRLDAAACIECLHDRGRKSRPQTALVLRFGRMSGRVANCARASDFAASADAIRSGRLTLRPQQSPRRSLKEPPEPRTQKCRSPPMRAGHEHPADSRGTSGSRNPELPSTQVRSARGFFLPGGRLRPRIVNRLKNQRFVAIPQAKGLAGRGVDFLGFPVNRASIPARDTARDRQTPSTEKRKRPKRAASRMERSW
jgi:hypothetical protein